MHISSVYRVSIYATDAKATSWRNRLICWATCILCGFTEFYPGTIWSTSVLSLILECNHLKRLKIWSRFQWRWYLSLPLHHLLVSLSLITPCTLCLILLSMYTVAIALEGYISAVLAKLAITWCWNTVASKSLAFSVFTKTKVLS